MKLALLALLLLAGCGNMHNRPQVARLPHEGDTCAKEDAGIVIVESKDNYSTALICMASGSWQPQPYASRSIVQSSTDESCANIIAEGGADVNCVAEPHRKAAKP
jgi:hypothetical protein